MTPFPWIDVAVIAGLVVFNGIFAMSELAIVSSRPARLRVAAERGQHGAHAALTLTEDPGKLLSTAQIGITLVALITGANKGLGFEMARQLAKQSVTVIVAARDKAAAAAVAAQRGRRPCSATAAEAGRILSRSAAEADTFPGHYPSRSCRRRRAAVWSGSVGATQRRLG